MDLTGRILFIDEPADVSKQQGKTFMVSAFAIEGEDNFNGNIYPWQVSFQATGDKTKLLDDYKPGDYVQVFFNLKGTVAKSDKKKAGPRNPDSLGGFNNCTLIRIQKAQDPYAQAPVTQAAVQQNLQQGQGGYAAQSTAQNNNGMPPVTSTEGKDDLPF